MKKLLFILLAISLFSCDSDAFSTDGTVKYTVTSNKNGFSITYENENGGTSQRDISGNSWDISFTGDDGDFVYISAQADNENQSISTQIKYRGDVIDQATSDGDYVIATSSGTLE